VRAIFLLLLSLAVQTPSSAQEMNADQLIRLWEVSGRRQTIEAETSYDDLHNNVNPLLLKPLLAELHRRIDRSASERLKIRLLMYESLAYNELKSQSLLTTEKPPIVYKGIIQTIKRVNLLGDTQLLSELYTLFPNVTQYTTGELLLYTFKAVEIQDKIGSQYFPKLYLRYITLSDALYRINEFRFSINVGLKSLRLRDKFAINDITRVQQYDLIASCYRELGVVDSVYFYYRLAKEVLDRNRDPEEAAYREIWYGVIDGGIAQGYFLENKDGEAIPLLKKNIHTSLKHNQLLDASMAQNLLSAIYFRNGAAAEALSGWKNVMSWATGKNAYKYLNEAALGISEAYQKSNRIDSALFYARLYTAYKDSLNTEINGRLLDYTHVRVAFDDLQASMNETTQKLEREKLLRNFVIGFILLVSAIVILLINRNRLKEKLSVQILAQQQQQAMFEVTQARKQLGSFINSVIEKNSLIAELKKELTANEQSRNQQEIIDKLSEYTFISEGEWERFRLEFSRANPAFLPKLYKLHPNISPAEERLATMICLHLNNLQISNTLGISKDSVARSKRRLKQKLELDTSTDLEQYLLSF